MSSGRYEAKSKYIIRVISSGRFSQSAPSRLCGSCASLSHALGSRFGEISNSYIALSPGAGKTSDKFDTRFRIWVERRDAAPVSRQASEKAFNRHAIAFLTSTGIQRIAVQ